jgi:hypothetical protein
VRWEVTVRFVDIDEIVDYHCLKRICSMFITLNVLKQILFV